MRWVVLASWLAAGCGVQETVDAVCTPRDPKRTFAIGAPFQVVMTCAGGHVAGLRWRIYLDRNSTPFPPIFDATATQSGEQLELAGTVDAVSVGEHRASIYAEDPVRQVSEFVAEQSWMIVVATP